MSGARTKRFRPNSANRDEAIMWCKIQSWLNTVNHLFVGLVAIYEAIYHRSSDSQIAAWTVMGLGLLAVGVFFNLRQWAINIIFGKDKAKAYRIPLKWKFVIHGILQILGSVRVFNCIPKNGLNGLFAKILLLLCVASLFGGLLNYREPKYAQRFHFPEAMTFRQHSIYSVTFTVVMTAIYYGYRQYFYEFIAPQFMFFISGIAFIRFSFVFL